MWRTTSYRTAVLNFVVYTNFGLFFTKNCLKLHLVNTIEPDLAWFKGTRQNSLRTANVEGGKWLVSKNVDIST